MGVRVGTVDRDKAVVLSSVMSMTHVQEIGAENWYSKLAQK